MQVKLSKELATFVAKTVEAGEYVDAVQATVEKLANRSDLGLLRFKKSPELKGIRSLQVHAPYQRHLNSYRFDDEALFAERIIHGARDFPRRLLQSSYDE